MNVADDLKKFAFANRDARQKSMCASIFVCAKDASHIKPDRIPFNDGILVGTTIEEQTKQVFENIRAILDEAQMSFENVVKTTVFLSDMSNFQSMNEIYALYFSSDAPARSTVAVKDLPKGALVEIEIIAIK